jgi:hypothetical protein
MLSNFPLIDFIKRLSKNKVEYPDDNLTYSLYDIFNAGTLRDWEVDVHDYDKNRIIRAQKVMESVSITKDLSDIQLLKLHSDIFPDYDMVLVYHTDFGMYEVKNKQRSKFLFTYNNGLYTPVDSIF